MLKRRYILMFATLLLLFAGCVQDKTEDVKIDILGCRINASIETPDSRVQLAENNRTVWSAGDRIAVVSTNYARAFEFEGATGDTDGSFKEIGTFDVVPPYEFDRYYAIYSLDTFGGWSADDNGNPALLFKVLSEQSYMPDSYGLHSNIMFGESEDGKNFVFKNMLGYLRLSLTGGKCVQSIKITNSANTPLSGEAYFFVSDPSRCHWLTRNNYVTLNCGEGVQLSDKATNFYFALPPMTFKQGFVVEVSFTDGSSYTQFTNKIVAIKRNVILPMAVMNADFEQSDYHKLTLHYSGEIMRAPLFAGAFSGEVDWGDGNVTLLNKYTSYDFVNGNDSHVVTFSVLGAETFEIESCEGITKIDLSNF